MAKCLQVVVLEVVTRIIVLTNHLHPHNNNNINKRFILLLWV
jgi:hypothetical protein